MSNNFVNGKQKFLASFIAVFLSVFAVAVIAYGSSTMDTASVGVGTSTPGAALGVKGGAVISDFVYSSSLTATTTLTLTSVTATSSTRFGFTIASSSFNVSGVSGAVTIGTSTGPADADVANTHAVDPALTVSGVGSALNATGTVYIAGGGSNGGQIILKSSDGTHCVSILANALGIALDASGSSAATLLTTKVVACPK